MGEALFDLEHVLRSKKEQLTLQEANIMLAWRAQAMRDFTVGFGGGSVVTWLASQRLNRLHRLYLSVGTAAVCGLWSFRRSVDSSVERILSLEGSRIQSEFANILLRRYYNNPSVLQRLSKHFYSEEVYDDSSVDRPMLRWRFRNFFGEHISDSQDTSHGEDSDSHRTVASTTTSTKTTRMETTRTSSMEMKQVSSSEDDTKNPFDVIFGFPESAETVPNASTMPRKETLREKRSRRRHRRHRHHHDQEEYEV